MAKVLLINSNRFKHPWPVIPFGLCYVAASLETNGNHRVCFLDLCFSSDCEKDIKNSIRNFVPDVIGVSIRNIDDTGGYNVHFLLEDVKNDVIDYCKPEFVNRIESGDSLEGLKGLTIRKGKLIIQDDKPFRVEDLDSLPFPKPLRYLDLKQYRRFGSPLHIQTKRGCAFRCSYCTYNQIEGNRYRLRNPRLIADEIDILVKETGVNHIEFTDSTFNVPLEHTKKVLRELILKNLDLRLHTMGLNPGAVDEELLDLMKSAGFNEVDIGAESACDEVLESLAKNFKRNDILKTATLLKRKNIPVTWFIILGAPAETRESVTETLNTIGKVASKWDMVFISTGIRVYKGAPIADSIQEYNNVFSSDNFLHPVKIEPCKISLEDIHIIAKRTAFRFPNFYFYEKEKIIPGWLLITGNYMLRLFHSRQPVWRLLIFLKMIERILGISLIKRVISQITRGSRIKKNTKTNGFSLI